MYEESVGADMCILYSGGPCSQNGAIMIAARSYRNSLVSALALVCGAAGSFAACSDESDTLPLGGDAQVDVNNPQIDTGVTPDFDAGSDADDPDADLPEGLAATGLYSNIAQKTLSSDVKPYTPGLTFWSDGAVKTRYLYLPPGQKIDTSDMDEWVFPVGTKVWKEFKVGGKLTETRIFWKKGADDWRSTTYLWAADGMSATRHDDGVPPATDGGYEIPTAFNCKECHRGRKDKLLGVEARSLGHPDATGVTLASLAADGKLTVAPPSTSITTPTDARFAGDALAWLHINCGVACHNRNTSAEANFTGLFMRLSVKAPDGGVLDVPSTDTYKTAVGQAVTTGYAAQYPGFQRIAMHDAAHSLIPTIAGLRGPGQMPPIITHQPDTVGVDKVKAWINAP
jgi:hypothetical protein